MSKHAEPIGKTRAAQTPALRNVKPVTVADVRRAFVDFFVRKNHTHVESASLIPHDPTLLFTVAGMVPFKPYFLGEETPSCNRAVSVQKCVRAGGKHNDIEEIGRTSRHLTFFEMLGNFSFGDYFKEDAIVWAWELVTESFGLDTERLWVTVHNSDDEAEAIWLHKVGVPPERVQRLGSDNYWRMADVGPCGPCSEIFWDKGPQYGSEGGPACGSSERYVEIWNLVFMQFESTAEDGENLLPQPSIDTGMGLERIAAVLQGVDSVWEIDEFVVLIRAAKELTGVRSNSTLNLNTASVLKLNTASSVDVSGVDVSPSNADTLPSSVDVSLRIIADHARSMSLLISDGVFPSNEERGYVLRRIIRRAVRHAWLLGVQHPILAEMVDATVQVMGEAWPDLKQNHAYIRDVVDLEEKRFRETLRVGQAILDERIASLNAGERLGGDVAFLLHDTYGFPLAVTEEIATEQGVAVDVQGFELAMNAQRARARNARKAVNTEDVAPFVALVSSMGLTDFVGRDQLVVESAKVLYVSDNTVVLDRTPFYAESGGQIGDTGELFCRETGAHAYVTDTVYGVPGLHVHKIVPASDVSASGVSEFEVGDLVSAKVDVQRRAAIRRSHTGTHILHWALREVVGSHVKQQGSWVGPDRLRFDFSHYQALTSEQMNSLEYIVNQEVLANESCRHFETTFEHAKQIGAIAFFGDKYGDVVRVLEAGHHSVELCGGTHVKSLGDIGAVRVVSESSIGANIRRIEAVTGLATLDLLRSQNLLIEQAADALSVPSTELVQGIAKRQAESKELRAKVKELHRQLALSKADELTATACAGVVVARVDNVDQSCLRELALSIRDRESVKAVVLGAVTSKGGAALVSAVSPGARFNAGHLISQAKRTIGGGGRPSADIAMAGGSKAQHLDEALRQAREAAGVLGICKT